MKIQVKVTPKAKENRVVGWEHEVLKVRVTAAPDKGAANQAVARLLADHFKIPLRAVVLVQGATARLKIFELTEEPKNT